MALVKSLVQRLNERATWGLPLEGKKSQHIEPLFCNFGIDEQNTPTKKARQSAGLSSMREQILYSTTTRCTRVVPLSVCTVSK